MIDSSPSGIVGYPPVAIKICLALYLSCCCVEFVEPFSKGDTITSTFPPEPLAKDAIPINCVTPEFDKFVS